MIRSQVDYITKLANMFETRTNLLSLAKIDVNYTFELKLSQLLRKSISSKNVVRWVEKNYPLLKEFIAYPANILPSGILRFNSPINLGNKKAWAIISTSPQTPESYEIITSSLLNGEENIPNLWLHLATLLVGASPPVGVDLAHNDYILLAFQSMFGNDKAGLNDKTISAAQFFYSSNKEKLDKLRNNFKERPKLIGEGADGVVFSIGPDLILKIFKDDFSYLKAKETIKRLHDFPELAKTEAMIYDTGELGEYQGHHIYYYIMEKMKPITKLSPTISSSIGKIASAIGDYIYMRSKEGRLLKIKSNIDEYMKTQSSREDLFKILNEMNKFIERFIKIKYINDIKIINDELKDNINEDWLKSLIEEISIKYLTGRGDLHHNNLGLTNFGLFRYFDPTTYDWKTGLNLGEKYKSDKNQL